MKLKQENVINSVYLVIVFIFSNSLVHELGHYISAKLLQVVILDYSFHPFRSYVITGNTNWVQARIIGFSGGILGAVYLYLFFLLISDRSILVRGWFIFGFYGQLSHAVLEGLFTNIYDKCGPFCPLIYVPVLLYLVYYIKKIKNDEQYKNMQYPV